MLDGPQSHVLDELRDAISLASAWHRAFGNAVFETALATFVVNEAHPCIWSANHVSRVRASTRPEIEAVLAEMESRFAHCRHRVVFTDEFTPPAFVARLSFAGYREQTPVIQMALLEELTPTTSADVTLRPVGRESDWQRLRGLVEADFNEGLRAGRKSMPPEVVSGLFEGYKRKRQVAQFFIAEAGEFPCAYGSAVECPNKIGLLEDFFTLPSFRQRGIASTLLGQCVGRLRERGCRSVFIGALATESAKHLYAELGFTPLMISREWVKE